MFDVNTIVNMDIEFEIFDMIDAARKAAGVNEYVLAKHMWPEASSNAAAMKYSRMMNPRLKKNTKNCATDSKRQTLSITDAIRACDYLGLSFLEVTASVMARQQDWPKSRLFSRAEIG